MSCPRFTPRLTLYAKAGSLEVGTTVLVPGFWPDGSSVEAVVMKCYGTLLNGWVGFKMLAGHHTFSYGVQPDFLLEVA